MKGFLYVFAVLEVCKTFKIRWSTRLLAEKCERAVLSGTVTNNFSEVQQRSCAEITLRPISCYGLVLCFAYSARTSPEIGRG